MSDSPWDDPDAQEWVERARTVLVPMLDSSAVTVSLAPPVDSPDIKFAVELGLTIMMDKPLLLVVTEGRPIPAKLRMLADDIVYIDWDSAESQANLNEHIGRFAQRYAGED